MIATPSSSTATLNVSPDFRFCRMHVDVDGVRRHLDEQVHLGAALLDRRLAVRVDDRVRDRAILDDAAVDEDVLRAPRRARVGERGDESGQPQTARLLPDLYQIGPLAV